MNYNTTNTYALKREILTFSRHLSSELSRPNQKFVSDMVYGILASRSCLLTDIADQLLETGKKINTVDRLSNHLMSGVPDELLTSYLRYAESFVSDDPTIFVDESDVIKPNGKGFESLGLVRDGSRSTKDKNIYEKGYHVTEACALSRDNHPISIFSHIHSSLEKDYRSANTITYDALERGAYLFGTATFVMDRGYDDAKMFAKMEELKQHYIIRLKTNRSLYYKDIYTPVTKIRDAHKGRYRMRVYFKDEVHDDIYISYVPIQVTADRFDATLIMVYGLSDHPMLLLTNRNITGKDDAISTVHKYFSRWRIEEYFRCKKQSFNFEDFRVRKLAAINALNFYITLCMTFLSVILSKSEGNSIKYAIIKAAAPIRTKVYFQFYRISQGIQEILKHAQSGIRGWFKVQRPKHRQLMLSPP